MYTHTHTRTHTHTHTHTQAQGVGEMLDILLARKALEIKKTRYSVYLLYW